jgi:hypothetical protein
MTMETLQRPPAETVATPADAFLQVETHGIEAIPAAERHGSPRDLGFLWAGAFANYASLLTASLLTTYYGLGVWDGLAATLLGTVAGALILGLLSNTGPRSGEPQIVFTRRIFGRRGSYAGAPPSPSTATPPSRSSKPGAPSPSASSRSSSSPSWRRRCTGRPVRRCAAPTIPARSSSAP